MTQRPTRLVLALALALLGFRADAQELPANAAWVNSGQEWATMTVLARAWYVKGFQEGTGYAFNKTVGFLIDRQGSVKDSEIEPLRLATMTEHDASVLADLVTDLYRDPANTYITHAAMIYIARDKLNGKDTEPLLREARLRERAYYFLR